MSVYLQHTIKKAEVTLDYLDNPSSQSGMSECLAMGKFPQQKPSITSHQPIGRPDDMYVVGSTSPPLILRADTLSFIIQRFCPLLPLFTPARRVVWWDTHSCYLENQGYADNLHFFFIVLLFSPYRETAMLFHVACFYLSPGEVLPPWAIV